jgi:hypothetical protein
MAESESRVNRSEQPPSWRAFAAILAVALISCDSDPAMRNESAGAPGIEPAAAPELRCTGCNLLLISIDTLRADRLGSYGYSRPTSPHIDALASKSLLYRDVLAQASSTVPSHKSIFSGLYVFEHRNRLDGKPVMAQLLADAGYRTGAFVDGGYLARDFGMDRGFETYFNADVAAGVAGSPHGLRVINPAAIGWMTQHAEQPFFAFVHTYDVHCPYTPPEPYRSMFTGGYVPQVDLGMECDGDYEGVELEERDFVHVSALYDGGIRYDGARDPRSRPAPVVEWNRPDGDPSRECGQRRAYATGSGRKGCLAPVGQALEFDSSLWEGELAVLSHKRSVGVRRPAGAGARRCDEADRCVPGAAGYEASSAHPSSGPRR